MAQKDDPTKMGRGGERGESSTVSICTSYWVLAGVPVCVKDTAAETEEEQEEQEELVFRRSRRSRRSSSSGGAGGARLQEEQEEPEELVFRRSRRSSSSVGSEREQTPEGAAGRTAAKRSVCSSGQRSEVTALGEALSSRSVLREEESRTNTSIRGAIKWRDNLLRAVISTMTSPLRSLWRSD
ncbi:hypothetical protein EYF80_058418 [Liparis tanakae]|uniref:Uncharacterized protein n=1 Tax=Liparis tanakae TaxID=230148 RepID=A0A4Z2ES61_9TELE|nr:hypothetical protein EYF80_058418 [Liparis tanakae]